MAARRRIDWDRIQREFRLGQLSVRELSRQHGVNASTISRRAAKEGWVRDVSGEVRARTNSALVSQQSTPTEEDVNLAVQTNVQVVLGHRKGITNLKKLSGKLMTMLEKGQYTVGEGESAKVVPLDPREMCDIYRSLTQGLAKLVPLERQAFGMDDKNKDDGPQKVEVNINL